MGDVLIRVQNNRAVIAPFGASVIAPLVSAATTAKTDAEAARDLAEQWANEDEDIEVSGGEYSAKHYSLKAAAAAGAAATDAAADVAAALAADLAASESARDDAEAAAATSTTQAGLATTARAGAEAAESNAALSALAAAAEATLYPDVATGVAATTDGDLFYVQTEAGLWVYQRQSGAGVELGPVGEVAFDTVAGLKASTLTTLGPTGNVLTANGWRYQVVTSGEHLTTAGGVKLQVLKHSDGAYHTAALGDPATAGNDTPGVAALLALAANGKLVFDYRATAYACDNLIPAANTQIWIAPGTTVQGRTSSSRCFQLQKENITLEGGPGATIQRVVGQTSHVVYISASTANWAKNVVVRGLTILGNGASGTGGTGENDCIYIGGSPQGVGGNPANEAVPENILVEKCILRYPRRNVVSIVAGKDVTIRDNLLDGQGAVVLQCGVDIEANVYMADGSLPIENAKVYRNKIINVGFWGIVCVFGNVEAYENRIIVSGGASGIGVGAGGAQYNDSVYRDGDRLGCIAFDNATGNITVRGAGQASLHDLGIHVGMWVQGSIKIGSGGAFPTGLVSPYRYAISWISTDGTQMRVSAYYLHNEVTSFSGSPVGTLNEDPTVADLEFRVFRPGPSPMVTARNNVILGTTTTSLINLSTFYKSLIEGNRIVQSGTGGCISAAYGYRPVFKGNDVEGGIRGISAGAVTLPLSESNTIRKTTIDGVTLGGAGAISQNDAVLLATGDCFDIGNGPRQKVIGATAYNDDRTTSSVGIKLSSANGLIEGCNAFGSGSSVGASISASGTGVRVVNSTRKDGTWYP